MTIGDVITRVQLKIGSQDKLRVDEVTTAVVDRYVDLYNTHPWSRRTKDFTIRLRPQVESSSATTVTVAQDVSSIVSSGSPFLASYAGMQIQIGDDPQYFFASFESASILELETGEALSVGWVASSASAQDWRLFQTVYNLPDDAGTVTTLTSDIPLREFDGGREALDRKDPDRQVTNNKPTHWIPFGDDDSGIRRLEIWPIPTQARLLRGQYTAEIASATSATRVDIHWPCLVFGALSDCCYTLMSKEGSTSKEHWESMGLFYERKMNEQLGKIIPRELDKIGISTSFGLERDFNESFIGTDFEVDHQLGLPGR